MAAIVENSSDAIFAKDHAGRYLLANRAVERIVGKTAAQMTGQDDTFLFPQQAATIRVNDHLVMNENRTNTFEETLATAEGERTFLVTKGPLHDEQGQVIGMFGISRDITERKQAARQLGESEARFEVAMQASQDGLWEWNILTDEVYFTPRWYEILGYSREDQSLPAPTFKLWEERIHPDDHERVMSVLVSHLEKRTLYSVEYRHRHRSGEYRWQHARGLAIFDENGKPTKMVGTISDITERKQANQALQKSEESYRTLFREMQNGFAHSEIICDAQGRPVDSR